METAWKGEEEYALEVVDEEEEDEKDEGVDSVVKAGSITPETTLPKTKKSHWGWMNLSLTLILQLHSSFECTVTYFSFRVKKKNTFWLQARMTLNNIQYKLAVHTTYSLITLPL